MMSMIKTSFFWSKSDSGCLVFMAKECSQLLWVYRNEMKEFWGWADFMSYRHPSFNTKPPTCSDEYNKIRSVIVYYPFQEQQPADYKNNLFIHFIFCSGMKNFPVDFHNLWNKYFYISPINDIHPILRTRNANNLQRELTKNR